MSTETLVVIVEVIFLLLFTIIAWCSFDGMRKAKDVRDGHALAYHMFWGALSLFMIGTWS